MPWSRPVRQSRASNGSACQSRASGSASTLSISAASLTLRVIGPTCATVPNGESGHAGTRPNEALRPKRPVKLHGMRIEPPPSVPTASGPMPEATAAAAPPEEPPGVFFGSQGLRVMPVSGLSVTPFQPNSGVVVFPSSTAPCSRSRAVAGASSFHGPLGSTVFEPRSVGHPLVRMMSLIDTGTPSSNPFGCPDIHLASDAFASSIARWDTRLNAFSTGLSFSMRSSTARVTSTGDSSCLRYASSSAVALSAQRSAVMDLNRDCPYFLSAFARASAFSRHIGQARL